MANLVVCSSPVAVRTLHQHPVMPLPCALSAIRRLYPGVPPRFTSFTVLLCRSASASARTPASLILLPALPNAHSVHPFYQQSVHPFPLCLSASLRLCPPSHRASSSIRCPYPRVPCRVSTVTALLYRSASASARAPTWPIWFTSWPHSRAVHQHSDNSLFPRSHLPTLLLLSPVGISCVLHRLSSINVLLCCSASASARAPASPIRSAVPRQPRPLYQHRLKPLLPPCSHLLSRCSPIIHAPSACVLDRTTFLMVLLYFSTSASA